MKIGIAAIFKNEFDFVLEWLCYHRLIGVEQFYIADNVSNDGTSELLQILDYLGYIKRVYYPSREIGSPQRAAYNKILKQYSDDVDLLAFIDADEFLVSHKPLKESSVLQRFYQDSELSAMALNWKNFGSSGLKLPTRGLVLETYNKRSLDDFGVCKHIKSIVKPKRIDKMIIHNALLKEGAYCNTRLETNIFPEDKESNPLTSEICHDALHVNHYIVKSRIDQFVRKINKGSAGSGKKREKGLKYFIGHDKNDLTENFDTDIIAAVKIEVERLTDEINHCHHFIPTSKGLMTVDTKNNKVKGWVTNSKLEKVRLVVDHDEYIINIDKPREDVHLKGLTNGLNCGFEKRIQLNSENQISAYILGSTLPIKINILR